MAAPARQGPRKNQRVGWTGPGGKGQPAYPGGRVATGPRRTEKPKPMQHVPEGGLHTTPRNPPPRPPRSWPTGCRTAARAPQPGARRMAGPARQGPWRSRGRGGRGQRELGAIPSGRTGRQRVPGNPGHEGLPPATTSGRPHTGHRCQHPVSPQPRPWKARSGSPQSLGGRGPLGDGRGGPWNFQKADFG